MTDHPPAGPSTAVVLPPPLAWRATVVEVEPATPSIRRLHLGLAPAEDPAGDRARLRYAPGQDLALTLPGPAGSPGVRRRYSIRRYDPATGVVELEIVAHGDGPGARWVRGVRPGEVVDAFGPRGKITLASSATSHVFVCDDASFAATASMVEALPAGNAAYVVADLAGREERRVLAAPAGVELQLEQLDRGDEPPEQPDRVIGALGALELPTADRPGGGHLHAYVLGELHVVTAARRMLEGRLGEEHVSPKPYWRAHVPNQDHGEPLRDAGASREDDPTSRRGSMPGPAGSLPAG